MQLVFRSKNIDLVFLHVHVYTLIINKYCFKLTYFGTVGFVAFVWFCVHVWVQFLFSLDPLLHVNLKHT